MEIGEDKFTPKASISGQINKSKFRYDTTSTSSKNLEISTTITEKLQTGANLDFSVGGDVYRSSGSDVDANDQTKNANWSVNFSQPLLKGAGLDVNTSSVKIATIQELIHKNSLKETIQKTITDVILAYRSYLIALNQRNITRESLKNSIELLQINNSLVEAGRMPKVELIQSELGIKNNQFNIISSDATIDEMRLALISLLNIGKNTEINPSSDVTLEPFDMKEEQCINLIKKNNSTYLNSLLDLEISKLNLMVAKNNLLWDVSLFGQYGRDYARNETVENNGDKNWTAGLALNIPFGDKSSREGFMSAKIGLDKQKITMRELLESIENKVSGTLRNIEMKKKMVDIADDSISLSKQQLEVEKEKMKAGRSTNFQVISFQRSLDEAQHNRLNVIIGYLNTLTEFEALLGVTLDKWKIPLTERYKVEEYNW